MSVYTVLWLDCNGGGCMARFIPPDALNLAAKVREAATAAGWACGYRGSDYCPRCAKTLTPRHTWTRGICGTCRDEHTVAQSGVVILHTVKGKRNHYGRPLACDGGGTRPLRIVKWGARGLQRVPGWKESA